MSVISDLSQLLNSITNEQSKVHRYCWVLRKKFNFIFRQVLPAPNSRKLVSEIYIQHLPLSIKNRYCRSERGKKIVCSFPRLCPAGINMEKHFCNVMNTSVSIITFFLYVESASVQKKIALASMAINAPFVLSPYDYT